jgi:hypothetical protein
LFKRSYLTLVSDGEDAELLVYLVDEEKDIYIGVLVAVCHLGPVQLNPFSCPKTADLYEYTPSPR